MSVEALIFELRARSKNNVCIAQRPMCLSCRSYFFFSSRRRHTRFDCDWSSDVCSSDLQESKWDARAESGDGARGVMMLTADTAHAMGIQDRSNPQQSIFAGARYLARSEERRVGKECRSRWSPYH